MDRLLEKIQTKMVRLSHEPVGMQRQEFCLEKIVYLFYFLQHSLDRRFGFQTFLSLIAEGAGGKVNAAEIPHARVNTTCKFHPHPNKQVGLVVVQLKHLLLKQIGKLCILNRVQQTDALSEAVS